MEYSKNCPFCNESRFENNKLIHLPEEESILFENENIYVQSDISPLCLGHILIITNKHYLNFYEASDYVKEDVVKLKESIRKVYRELYGTDVLFFEHGSAQPGYAGSSIDHAHLHCIPYKFDINDDLNSLGEPIECNILEPSDFKNEFSYIYVESPKNGKKIYKVSKLPSQFLRKLISEKQKNTTYMWQEKCATADSKSLFNQTVDNLKNKLSI